MNNNYIVYFSWIFYIRYTSMKIVLEITVMLLLSGVAYTRRRSPDIPPRTNLDQSFNEDLCEAEPETFVCKWVSYDGEVIDSPSRPAPNYLQVAGTTNLDPEYHQAGTEMLITINRNMPVEVFNGMANNGRVGLFTFEDKTTIFPEYRIYRDRPECEGTCDGLCFNTCTGDGRKYDSLAGLGGIRATCVDDNFMCTESDPYFYLDHILLHEYAHTVHYYALNEEWQERIDVAYDAAYANETWDLASYAMSNPAEYFAEGVGVYFYVNFWNSTGGMNSCGRTEGYCESEEEARFYLQQEDLELYDIISYVFFNSDDTIPGGLTVCPGGNMKSNIK